MAEIALSAPAGIAALKPVSGLAYGVFRGNADAEAKAGNAFGLAFPHQMNRATTAGERAAPGARAALRIGPDEVLLIVPEAEGEAIFAAVGKACAKNAHSLVDVSHRQQGYALVGEQAEALINSGCPLDLSTLAFPVGMATRTLFHKAEIILWRVGEDAFRIEAWRSFGPYIEGMFAEAAKDHLPAP